MALRTRKLTVFQQLSQENAPISLSTLLDKLGPTYVARTVR